MKARELYPLYRIKPAERIAVVAAACLAGAAIGWLLYGTWWGIGAMAALGPLVWRPYVRLRREAARERIDRAFQQALYAVSTSLAAGKSVENAFRDAPDDLKLIGGRIDFIMDDLLRIRGQLAIGEPLEKALANWADRTESDTVRQFAEVFSACKRTGGNLADVIRQTTHLMGEKQDIARDIAIVVSRKRWEARALTVIPFAILAMLRFTSPDYVQPLYSPAGAVVMTGALLLVASAVIWMNAIVKLKV
ncbi:type II secretion system F family protein [Paenibacillus thermoaerophilus]|jgi:tight adherence protein B|uniref:Type II secretion system F family protein n=1 Tax=Paenibacillus thermoaerophilus TaxID=1215385 RepID=A0ABW2V7L8_9BACL|nr:type II secretion system F family protein [Paenibacillus thermoaerophilus]